MHSTGNGSGGYGIMKGRKSKRTAEKKAEEALETMFEVIREFIAAGRNARTGKTGMDEYAAAMRKLLRHVRRKVKETAGTGDAEQASRRKECRSMRQNAQRGGKGAMRR